MSKKLFIFLKDIPASVEQPFNLFVDEKNFTRNKDISYERIHYEISNNQSTITLRIQIPARRVNALQKFNLNVGTYFLVGIIDGKPMIKQRSDENFGFEKKHY